MELSYYESATCPGCGTHHELGRDLTVERNVEMTKRPELVCEDCRAIAADRERHHRERNHADGRCDCDDHVWFVDRRTPLPPEDEE